MSFLMANGASLRLPAPRLFITARSAPDQRFKLDVGALLEID
jgi:hypothetical protein